MAHNYRRSKRQIEETRRKRKEEKRLKRLAKKTGESEVVAVPETSAPLSELSGPQEASAGPG